MSQERDDFLKAQSERLEGYVHGLPELIDELNFQNYGRGITQASDSNKGNRLIGYILPLKPDQTSHLLMFNTGDILIVESVSSKNRGTIVEEGATARMYKVRFSSNQESFEIYGKDNIPRAINYLANFECNVVLRNNNPDHNVQIGESIEKAMVLAKELKAQRMEVREKTSGFLMSQLRDLLRDN